MATQKWLSNLSSSTDRMKSGVLAVTVAPGQKAAAQRTKWLQRVTQAADKWAARTGSVTLQDWQNSMVNVGIPRVAQGAQQKQGKMQSFLTDFLPYLQQGVSQIDNMPKVTIEDSIARATAMIRHNANYKRGNSSSGLGG
jgi:hypothetical protein